MAENNLYFIAAIPPRELQDKVIALKNDMAIRFHSVRALKVVPHITLKAPFTLPAALHAPLLQWFDHFEAAQQVFSIALQGFGAFNNPINPVIFIKPVNHAELSLLQHNLINSFKGFAPSLLHPVDRKFVPHMTIAYRDLTPDNFKKAWTEYRDRTFDELFEIAGIHLLQHDRVQWNIIASRPLGGI